MDFSLSCQLIFASQIQLKFYFLFKGMYSANQNPKPQEVQAGALGAGPDTDYNFDLIPPNFEDAKLHRTAWRVGKLFHSKQAEKRRLRQRAMNQVADLEDIFVDQVCPCCTRKVPPVSVSVGCDSREYAFLGTGLPLYFEYIKNCILMLFIMFVTSGNYNIVTNLAYGEDCKPITDPQESDDNNFCALTWVTRVSLANKRQDAQFIELQQMLNLISMITLIALFQVFRKDLRLLDKEIDEAHSYASDYTIHIKNIPTNVEGLLNNDFDDDLKKFFEDYVQKFKNEDIEDIEKNRREKITSARQQYKPLARVACVNLCYRLEEMLNLEKQKQAKIIEKQKVSLVVIKISEGVDPNDPNVLQGIRDGTFNSEKLRQVQQEIQALDNQINILENRFEQGQDVKDQFLGQAFITFQWESDVEAILNEQKTGFCSFKPKVPVIYRGQVLQISEPPEPTDVFWDNLHLSTKQKIIRRIIGNLVTFCILAGCGYAIYFLTAIQANAAREQAAAIKRGDTDSHTGVKILAFIASLLIQVINFVLAVVIDLIAKFEGYSTQTGYNISLASKSSLAQFCNTALMTFMINAFITQNTFGNGGLIYNQTYVFITNAVVPAVVQLLDAGTISKWLFIKLEEKKGYKSVKTQKQLHDLYEKPIFNISTSYAAVLKNMYVVAFYASIIPIGLIVTCIALILHYWVEKYNISRRRCIKYSYGTEMAVQMIEWLEFVLPIYCLTNLYWEYEFSGHEKVSTMAILGVALGVANAALPMQAINEALFSMEKVIDEIVPVDVAEYNFLTDYSRENPATYQNARTNYTKRVEKHKKQQELMGDLFGLAQ